jgi:hypothetical protein
MPIPVLISLIFISTLGQIRFALNDSEVEDGEKSKVILCGWQWLCFHDWIVDYDQLYYDDLYDVVQII